MNGDYICPFPNCGKTFKHSESAKRHFNATHNGAEFKCQICPSVFNRNDTLKRHAMQQHGLNETMANAMLLDP